MAHCQHPHNIGRPGIGAGVRGHSCRPHFSEITRLRAIARTLTYTCHTRPRQIQSLSITHKRRSTGHICSHKYPLANEAPPPEPGGCISDTTQPDNTWLTLGGARLHRFPIDDEYKVAPTTVALAHKLSSPPPQVLCASRCERISAATWLPSPAILGRCT